MKTIINALKTAFAWSKRNPKKALGIFAAVAIIGSLEDSKQSETPPEATSNTPIVAQPAKPVSVAEETKFTPPPELVLEVVEAPVPELEDVINVPSLLGLSIDGALSEIDAPVRTYESMLERQRDAVDLDQKITLNVPYDEFTLSISYIPNTRKIVSLRVRKKAEGAASEAEIVRLKALTGIADESFSGSLKILEDGFKLQAE